MEYNTTGDGENICNTADTLSSNKWYKKIKDPGKVAGVFNTFFLSIAEN
jgi:hypothetical protein